MNLGDSVTTLKGIGSKKAERLKKLKIETIEDILYYFPRTYQDRRNITDIHNLEPGASFLISGKIAQISGRGSSYGKKGLLKAIAYDKTAGIEILFFNANYLSRVLKQEDEYYFFGHVKTGKTMLQMVNPEFFSVKNANIKCIAPIYSLTSGISQNELRKFINQAICACECIDEYLPYDLRKRNGLCGISDAIKNIHFPKDKKSLLEAKFRIAFDDLLMLQIGMKLSKQANTDYKAPMFDKKIKIEEYTKNLPYEMTDAQKKVTAQIIEDLESGKTMNRIVQGDVGSGKTAVAEAALYKAVKSGYQGAFMAPTELLANQHYKTLKEDLKPCKIDVACLTGSMNAGERRKIQENTADGSIDILVGTHALIQEGIKFANLGLVITDEQHRFGVRQRELLREKGKNSHVLIMTATPIPRTLAVVIYGDLDISIIDELPPGRQKITTKTVEAADRWKIYDFVEKQIKNGRQAYVVAPLIEDSEMIDAVSADAVYTELAEKFKGYRCELIYGAMKQIDKYKIMETFYAGEIDILVSTVIVEVGINVPNATIMVIENCERFGLAQLHQLRGRIGRGGHKSYCFLVKGHDTELGNRRAEIMTNSNDGFYIAEQDLKLRGPGELFGTKQHGIPDLHMADLAKHISIMENAGREASAIIREAPCLEGIKYAPLKKRVISMFGENLTLSL